MRGYLNYFFWGGRAERAMLNWKVAPKVLCIKHFLGLIIIKATLQKESSKQSLPKVSSEAAICRCSSKQMFLTVSFAGKHFCGSHFLIIKSLFKRDLTHVFSCEYCKIFMKSFFNRKPPVASVDLLFLTRSNMGWFLLKRVDLVIVCVIYTSVETLLMNLQKPKTCPKWTTAAKAICSDVRILTV